MLIDLQTTIGLPIKMYKNVLELQEIKVLKKEVFKLEDMNDYFLNPISLFPCDVYEKYKIEDKEGAMQSINIGFNLYKLNPQLVGVEYSKIRGYFLDIYPRVLEVNYGKVMAILQKPLNNHTGQKHDVLVAKLSAKSKIIIPPNWGLMVVNSTNDVSIFSIVNHLEEAEISDMKEYKGSAVFVIYRNKQPEVVKNPQYREYGYYVKIKPEIEKYCDLSPKTPLIKQFLRKYDKYNWFYKPHKFDWSKLYF